VDAFATGTTMLLDLPSDLTVAQILACYDNPTEECIHEIVLDVVFNSPRRDIPANVERSLYTREEFIQAFIDSPATPGPAGHGFDVVNEVEDRVYYVFDLSDDVRGIILDSVTIGIGDDGAIGTNQAAWLEDELAKVNAYYYDADGDVVLTGNPDQLVVIFSHHDSETLDNTDVSDDDPDPVKLTPAEFEALLHRYPNVILWANGHEHWNRVWAHADPLGWTGGFWEVNTASFIDYPQQARDIEIVENADGTLSIFAVLIDHLASPTTSAHDLDTLGIAAISRELAANDPAKDIDTQIGEPSDRNVELLINKPF
jgi:metallophosphoesterase (TIGR03767 family)